MKVLPHTAAAGAAAGAAAAAASHLVLVVHGLGRPRLQDQDGAAGGGLGGAALRAGGAAAQGEDPCGREAKGMRAAGGCAPARVCEAAVRTGQAGGTARQGQSAHR